jgi:hypothetical protein
MDRRSIPMVGGKRATITIGVLLAMRLDGPILLIGETRSIIDPGRVFHAGQWVSALLLITPAAGRTLIAPGGTLQDQSGWLKFS